MFLVFWLYLVLSLVQLGLYWFYNWKVSLDILTLINRYFWCLVSSLGWILHYDAAVIALLIFWRNSSRKNQGIDDLTPVMTSTLLSPTNVPVNFSLPILIRQSWREAFTSSSSHYDNNDGDHDPDNVGIIFPSENFPYIYLPIIPLQPQLS